MEASARKSPPASSAQRGVAAPPRLRRRERVHERGKISSCSAPLRSWWWVVVCVTALLPTLCRGQEEVERTEDGQERGANSKLAKTAEVWLPIALVSSLALLLIVLCIRKAWARASSVDEEEEEIGDVEEAKDEQGLGGGVERISRTAVVWDKRPSATASVTTASTSVTSSSLFEGASSGHGRSLSGERRYVSGALRSASKLPRYSSDRLQSPVHGGTAAAGRRRSGGGRMQRGDAGREERVREGATGAEATRGPQDASVGGNPEAIYIVHQ